MNSNSLIFLMLTIVLFSERGDCLTERRFNRLKEWMRRKLTGRKIAHAVRLAFHDCVGGCDGCININSADNKGNWLETVAWLDSRYDRFNNTKYLSRADFYQIAAIAAIDNSVANANVAEPDSVPALDIDFLQGRVDCPTSPHTNVNHTFPSGQWGHEQTLGFLQSEFGLSKRDAVALMGAHAVGGATGTSGQIGFWKGNEAEGFKWDTVYYDNLVKGHRGQLNFDQVEVSNITGFSEERWQWEAPSGGETIFMLNSDLAIGMNLDFGNGTQGQSTCSMESCPLADTWEDVLEYRDGERWMQDFEDGYEDMINTVPPGVVLRALF